LFILPQDGAANYNWQKISKFQKFKALKRKLIGRLIVLF